MSSLQQFLAWLAVCLLAVLTALVVCMWLATQRLERGLDAASHSIGKVQEQNAALRETLSGAAGKIGDALKAHAQETGEQFRKAGAGADALGQKVDALSGLMQEVEGDLQDFAETARQRGAESEDALRSIDYRLRAVALYLEESRRAPAAEGRPVLFSYFEGDDWKNDMDDYLRRLSALGIPGMSVYDGGGGKDTYSDHSGGEFILNGVYHRSLEIFNLLNGRGNKVVILAPGLARLEDNTLEIAGDADADSVELDGCLKWLKIPVKTPGTRWRATDAAGKQRTVIAGKGVAVRVQSGCRKNYLAAGNSHLLAKLQAAQHKDSAESRATPPFRPHSRHQKARDDRPFGGIGISFFIKGGRAIVVRDVVRGTPAEKAGLKRGDEITAVDGRPVSGLDEERAKNLIRGRVGTAVELTYTPYEGGAPRAISVERALLNASGIPAETEKAR